MRCIPTIDEAIAAVEAKLDAHRREAHQDDDGFHDCALCGMLEHRLGKYDRHKQSWTGLAAHAKRYGGRRWRTRSELA